MGSHMSGALWWLAERLSGSLEAGEREAVIGDIAESGANGAQALRDVLDLVVRRNWRVWGTLAAVGGRGAGVRPLDFRGRASAGFRYLVEVRRAERRRVIRGSGSHCSDLPLRRLD